MPSALIVNGPPNAEASGVRTQFQALCRAFGSPSFPRLRYSGGGIRTRDLRVMSPTTSTVSADSLPCAAAHRRPRARESLPASRQINHQVAGALPGVEHPDQGGRSLSDGTGGQTMRNDLRPPSTGRERRRHDVQIRSSHADQTWRVRAHRRLPNRLIQLPAFRHGEAHSRHRPDRDTKVPGSIRTMRGGRVNAPLLTARAVADLLGVSTETVLRWSRCGSLPSLCLPGGAIRFRQDDLDAWLEQRRRPGGGVVTHAAARRHAPRPAR